MRDVGFGAMLIAENAERDDRRADGSVIGCDRLDERRVRLRCIGVELDGDDVVGARRAHRGDLLVEVVGPARGKDDAAACDEPLRERDPDLAASTEEDNGSLVVV